MTERPEQESALVALLDRLRAEKYRFVAITPASHLRVTARMGEARDLRGVFGWNLPFEGKLLPRELIERLIESDIVERLCGGRLRSRYRVASIGEQLFVHSAFPTDEEDAVFFGPDTYRFVNFVARAAPEIGPVRRLVDIGAGSGAGGIAAADLFAGARITLTDLNQQALRACRINARHAGVEAEIVESRSLDGVAGAFDLAIANPPYIMDEGSRTYRDGGGMLGARLSLDWTLDAARRLEPGGHMLLYTGVAIVDGRDGLREAMEGELPRLGCSLRYGEIDPDIFGEELDEPPYREVERIAAVGAVIRRG